MRLHDQVWLSFHNLMLHKVRSILTSLGIIFGVGSVIAMLAISEGAKIQALAQIEAMGTDKISNIDIKFCVISEDNGGVCGFSKSPCQYG